jgi:DNA modification methylase
MSSPSSPLTLNRLIELTTNAASANRGTDRGRALLRQSLEDLGAGRSILVDALGHVIAGNKVLEAARALNLPIEVVVTDGDRLVVVQRRDLDVAADADARRLAVADNRIAELDLDWDPVILAQDGVPLDELFTAEEFERIVGHGLRDGQTDENEMVEPSETSAVAIGDLFAAGDHRVLCGDATNPAHVARVLGDCHPHVLVSDPPYGILYDPSWRHAYDPSARTAVGRVLNDDRADWRAAWELFPGSIMYVWHAGLHAGTVGASITSVGFELRAQVIWVKPHLVLGRGAYHWRHEPCWYAVRTGCDAHWMGDRTQTTVWEVPNLNAFGGTRDGENDVTGHSTQKPVRLFEIPILNHTCRGDAVFDPFLGSGTSLIAAHKTGRRCLAIELEPRYVQAALDRWSRFSGQIVERIAVGSADGDA